MRVHAVNPISASRPVKTRELSKFKGVSWGKGRGKWSAQTSGFSCWVGGKQSYLGRFDTEEGAVRKHNASVDYGGSSSGKGFSERDGCALIERGEKRYRTGTNRRRTEMRYRPASKELIPGAAGNYRGIKNDRHRYEYVAYAGTAEEKAVWLSNKAAGFLH